MNNASASWSSAEPLTTMVNCLHVEEIWSTAPEAYQTNVFVIIVNSLTALTATVGNLLVLLAVWKTPSLRTPSNILLCCLAFSDFLVGLVVQPSFALQKGFEIQQNTGAFCVFKIITTGSLSWICAGVSFLVISAISVDRYLAIRLHLRYTALVTARRVLAVAACFWLLCTALVIAWFAGASFRSLVLIIVVMDITSIAVTIFAYLKISQRVRTMQREIRDHMRLTPPNILNISRFKQSAVTVLYIIVLFLVCYIPFICALIMKAARGNSASLQIVYNYSVTVIYLNSTLNPFLYCFRCKDIRIAVFKTLGRKYTVDMHGDVIPLSACSTPKMNLKNLSSSTPKVSLKNLSCSTPKMDQKTFTYVLPVKEPRITQSQF